MCIVVMKSVELRRNEIREVEKMGVVVQNSGRLLVLKIPNVCSLT